MIAQHWLLETGTVLQDMLDGVHEGVPEHARQKMQNSKKIPTKLPDCIAHKKGMGTKKRHYCQDKGIDTCNDCRNETS